MVIFYVQPEVIAERLRRLNPTEKFWIQDNYIVTNMRIRTIKLTRNMEIRSQNGRTFLKIRNGGNFYQEIPICNPEEIKR